MYHVRIVYVSVGYYHAIMSMIIICNKKIKESFHVLSQVTESENKS